MNSPCVYRCSISAPFRHILATAGLQPQIIWGQIFEKGDIDTDWVIQSSPLYSSLNSAYSGTVEWVKVCGAVVCAYIAPIPNRSPETRYVEYSPGVAHIYVFPQGYRKQP